MKGPQFFQRPSKSHHRQPQALFYILMQLSTSIIVAVVVHSLSAFQAIRRYYTDRSIENSGTRAVISKKVPTLISLKFYEVWKQIQTADSYLSHSSPRRLAGEKKSNSYNHKTTIWVSHEYYLNPEFHKILSRAF